MIIKDERVAIVTDLHIGKHQDNALWHNIVLNFAKEFKDRLIKDNIKDIIICGDINDDRNEINVQSLHVVNEVFNIWSNFNINIIVGNHDAYYKNRSDINSLSLFSGWKNINVIDTPTEYNIFNKKIMFVPWSFNLDDIPKCNYLFGHLEINGFNLSKMKVCIKGIDSTNILQKADVTVSGHFHFRDDRKYKNGRILYVGSPYELDWSDCGSDARGFYYLNIPTGEFEFIEIKTAPKHKQIRFSEITSAGKITDDVRKEFNGNFINFVVDQEVSDLETLSEFVSKLNTFNPLSLKVEYILENRVVIEDSLYEFTAVDVKSSITEFIKMTDYDDKDAILDELYELYEKCKKDI